VFNESLSAMWQLNTVLAVSPPSMTASLHNGHKQQQERVKVVFSLILLAGVKHLIWENGFGEHAVPWVAVIVNTRLFVLGNKVVQAHILHII
jgi:hypothetical protein